MDRGHGCLDVWSKPEKLTLLHVKLGLHLVGKSTEYSRSQAEMCFDLFRLFTGGACGCVVSNKTLASDTKQSETQSQ